MWLFWYRNFSLNFVPFSALGGPPAALCAEQGEAGQQQQGHRAAGESLLPSLARSRWERDWDLINRGDPARERRHTRSRVGLRMLSASAELLCQ